MVSVNRPPSVSVRIINVWNRLSDEMLNASVAFYPLITNLLTPI